MTSIEQKAAAAVATLEGKGYTYAGGQLWRPPVGKAPNFDLVDYWRGQADNLLGEIIGCFDAAFAEGLNEALADSEDSRLVDLVNRRLMHVYWAAIGPSKVDQQSEAVQAAVPDGWKLVPSKSTSMACRTSCAPGGLLSRRKVVQHERRHP